MKVSNGHLLAARDKICHFFCSGSRGQESQAQAAPTADVLSSAKNKGLTLSETSRPASLVLPAKSRKLLALSGRAAFARNMRKGILLMMSATYIASDRRKAHVCFKKAYHIWEKSKKVELAGSHESGSQIMFWLGMTEQFRSPEEVDAHSHFNSIAPGDALYNKARACRILSALRTAAYPNPDAYPTLLHDFSLDLTGMRERMKNEPDKVVEYVYCLVLLLDVRQPGKFVLQSIRDVNRLHPHHEGLQTLQLLSEFSLKGEYNRLLAKQIFKKNPNNIFAARVLEVHNEHSISSAEDQASKERFGYVGLFSPQMIYAPSSWIFDIAEISG